VYFVSDWAILNDTKSKQLERILSQFHQLRASEIAQACILLESYHAVYRRDRLEQRRNQLSCGQSPSQKQCPPPTATQLQEIAQRMNAKGALNMGTEEVITQLQGLAICLRHYSLCVRAGLPKTASGHEFNNGSKLDPVQPDEFMNYVDERDELTEFWEFTSGKIRCQGCA
jgi:hypothetical protein